MKIKEYIRCNGFFVLWFIFFTVFASYLYAEKPEFSPTMTETQKNNAKKEVREAIHAAEKMVNEGKFPDSLRILFDAYAKEKKAQISKDAYHKIYDIVLYLIHEDQSPLMRYFRDQNISIYERNELLSELETLVEKDMKNDKKMHFQRKYSGPLVQIVTSQQLISKEKLEILEDIKRIVNIEYTSVEQKKHMRESVAQLQTLADQKFKEKEYVEAFRVIWDAVKKENEFWLGSESSTATYQLIESLLFIIHKDTSPLMVLFRNPEISLQEKKRVFSELRELAKGHPIKTDSLLSRGKYEGTLVQLMSSPKLNESEKLDILGYIQDGIEKEYSPIP
jgi:hypothetical protein